MKVILSLIACIKSIDLDDGTNLLQTGIKQHHTQDFVFDTDKWEQFDGYHLYEQHASATECFPTLPEAITKCEEAGDCGGIATQSNVCGGQYRVSHGGPHLAGLVSNWASYALRSWVRKSCMQSTGTKGTTGVPGERGLPLLWNGKDYGGESGEGNCSDYGGTTATTTIFDWDAAGWLEEPACYDPAAYNNDCYPTLQAAMDLCDKDAKCTSVQRMSTVCDGQYRLSHAHAVSLHWHQGDIDKNQMVCWTHDKPRAGWTKRVTCYNPGAKENDCYPTLDGAMDLCDKDATCVSVQSMSSVCDGQYRLSNEPIHLHTGAAQKVDVERDALVCWTHDNEKTAAEATTTAAAAAAATTTLTTIPGTIPGENTNVGGTECFGAIATWGPDFECNAKVSSFCADDSADGLDVSACCQDYCSSNQEKRTKKKDSEANSKEAEGERKSKRQESRSKRTDAESARKKQKKEAEWLQKRGAQETSNKKAEDERKTKRGYSESKKKNERSWKANMANAKKAAQRREATRKARRAESAKKNGGGESKKKGQQKEQKQKKKAAWKAKKEKRQKGRGRKGRKGPQVRR